VVKAYPTVAPAKRGFDQVQRADPAGPVYLLKVDFTGSSIKVMELVSWH
jgi:hypothetical protein